MIWTLAVVFLSLLGGSYAIDWDERVDIDDYIAFDDGFYNYTEVASYRYFNVTMYIYNMTSQKWFDEDWSNRPVWWHWVGIAIPDNIRHPDGALMWIDGGSNRGFDPPGEDDLTGLAVSLIAGDTGTIAAYVKQIPNQPIVFTDDETQRGRSEDAQIAYTWRKFVEDPATHGPNSLSRFPMTKACVKALDTITAVAKEKRPETDVTRFFAAGGSKRGWTTWMLGATDRRVVGIAPAVMSLLNWRPTMMAHYRSLGGWTFAFKDYWNENITMELENPNLETMFYHVDPYNYKERLATIPITVLSGTSDEFFFPSDSHYWFKDMTGPIWMMMNENSHHTLFPHWLRAYENVVAFWSAILEDKTDEIPTATWNMEHTEGAGTVTMMTSETPNRVLGFVAVTTENDTRRDFRAFAGVEPEFRPVLWDETDVEDLGDNTYRVYADEVEGRYVGLMIQARFAGTVTGEDFYHYITTEVNFIPDTFPFPECEGVACHATLV